MLYARVCFDSSIWNAIINQEEEHDLLSIQSWIKMIELGKATLLIPSIVITELAAHPIQDRVKLFELFLLRSDVEQLDITSAIASNAGKLRRQVIGAGQKMKTPDALIVAAAAYHRADLILSIDPHILRCDGKFGLAPKIGPPATGHDQPLFDKLT